MNTSNRITKSILFNLADKALESTHPETEYFNLRLNKFFFWFGVFCIAFASVLVILVLYFPIETGAEGQETPIFWTSGMFTFGGLYMFTSHFFHKIECGPESITIHRFCRKKRYARWNEIKHLTFRKSTNLVYIHLDNGKRLKISQYLIGLIDLFNQIERKTELNLSEIKNKILAIK